MKLRYLFSLILSLFLTACVSSGPQEAMAPVQQREVTSLIETASSEDPCDEVTSPSLQALQCAGVEGSDLELLFVEAQNASSLRYAIRYRNVTDELWISGVLLVPVGDGPFPLVVTNHGYIDPSVYTRGRGLKREQDALARAGFAVIHPDYRNHAESDQDPDNALQFRLGYVSDVIAAVKAVQSSELQELSGVDASRVGMLGHSMGGGITTQVAVIAPDLIEAVVLYAPVSAKAEENLERYFLRNNRRSDTVDQLYTRYGSPSENPAFWQGLSAYPILDQVKVPVLIFIGTADESVAPEWSYAIRDELLRLGKEVELVEYEGAPHEFIANFADFSERFVSFFQQSL